MCSAVHMLLGPGALFQTLWVHHTRSCVLCFSGVRFRGALWVGFRVRIGARFRFAFRVEVDWNCKYFV